MAEEVKRRVLRIILNSAVLFVLVITLNITLPGALAIISLIPQEGLTVGTVFILLLIIILTFQALRIILDLVRLVDFASEFLVNHIPGLKAKGNISVVKALKEITLVIILILVTTALFPVFLLIPEVEPWLSIGVSVFTILISVVLLYDAGKTLYAVFQSGLEFFIEKLVKGSKKSERTALTE